MDGFFWYFIIWRYSTSGIERWFSMSYINKLTYLWYINLSTKRFSFQIWPEMMTSIRSPSCSSSSAVSRWSICLEAGWCLNKRIFSPTPTTLQSGAWTHTKNWFVFFNPKKIVFLACFWGIFIMMKTQKHYPPFCLNECWNRTFLVCLHQRSVDRKHKQIEEHQPR